MPDASTILAALLLAVVPSLVYLAILNAIDRYEKEPWTILVACVGVGAIVAPLVSVAILAVASRRIGLPPAFAPGAGAGALTPIVESLVLGVLLILLVRSIRDEFDDILDGVIYGAAIGAGFGAAESFVYALGGTQLLTGGTIALLVIAGLNHAFYMAILGAVIGYAQGLPRGQRIVAVALGLATAAWAAAFHDTFPLIIANLFGTLDASAGVLVRLLAELINWLGLLTLGGVVVFAWRREARILAAELHDEVTSGVVPESDYATIGSFRRRLGRQWALLRTEGMGAVTRQRKRYAAEGELAFHKWRMNVRHRRRPPEARGDELRAQIRSLSDQATEGAA